MKKTISQVAPEPRIWEGGQYGPLAFIKVTFDDESQGDVACKPDNTENVIGILNGLKGKESDFQLEAKDDYQGIKQFKITGYPGKPGQQDGQRSGGGFQGGRQRHDPETNASIEAQVAAKIAGEMALGMLANKTLAENDPVAFLAMNTPKIVAAIRLAANGSQESGPTSPPSPPGGPLPSSGPDEAEGGTPGVSPSGPDAVTTPQLTKLAIMFKEQDIPAEERHEYVSEFLGREITSFKQLTKAEASRLIEVWLSEPEANGPDLGWGTGPMTPQQKAILNRLYGNGVTKAAHAMFPEVTKVGDINETMAAALIEDKE